MGDKFDIVDIDNVSEWSPVNIDRRKFWHCQYWWALILRSVNIDARQYWLCQNWRVSTLTLFTRSILTTAANTDTDIQTKSSKLSIHQNSRGERGEGRLAFSFNCFFFEFSSLKHCILLTFPVWYDFLPLFVVASPFLCIFALFFSPFYRVYTKGDIY